MAESITASQVKRLRDQTGAGIMHCKRALVSSEGDLGKAVACLRQEGITDSAPASVQSTAEGVVASYIHTGDRIGVLVELHCQTGPVAKHPEFQALAHNIAMQIAACSQVDYIQRSDIPQALVEKEHALELGRHDLVGKPDTIRKQIAAERAQKHLLDMCLLPQPYIRDQSITVGELVQSAIAQFGEEVRICRFSRFILGEGSRP